MRPPSYIWSGCWPKCWLMTIPLQQQKEKVPACPATAQPMGNCHNTSNEVTMLGTFTFRKKAMPVARCVVGCAIQVCRSAFYDIRTMDYLFMRAHSKPIKELFLSFVSLDLCTISIKLHVWFYKSLLFLSKPILLETYLAIWFLKVNGIHHQSRRQPSEMKA